MASPELDVRPAVQPEVVQEALPAVEQIGETQTTEASVVIAATHHRLTALERLHDIEDDWRTRGVNLHPIHY